MDTQVKVNYSEPCNRYSQLKILETRRDQSRMTTTTTIYFIKQKLSGLVMAALGIGTPFLLDGDATFSLIALPLGIYLIFTRQKVMTF